MNAWSPRVLVLEPIKSIIRHRSLVWALVRRELQARYRGSLLGGLWTVLLPIAMLLVYTFVFTQVFAAKWTIQGREPSFAIALFVGLVYFGFLAESLSRSPGLLLQSTSYITKMKFPLEILPLVAVLSSAVSGLIGLGVVTLGAVYVDGSRHLEAVYMVPLLVPLVFTAMGLSYAISALGIYFRDVGVVLGPLITMLMFLSPVFYSLSATPEAWRDFVAWSPLTYSIEAARFAALAGEGPTLTGYLINLVLSIFTFVLGLAFFQKLRGGFADVL